jgi:hypothetical protein
VIIANGVFIAAAPRFLPPFPPAHCMSDAMYFHDCAASAGVFTNSNIQLSERAVPMSGRYKLIACEILCREVCFCAACSRNCIDIAFMPKGLHDIGEQKMSARLQEQISSTDYAKYSAILLGYALCNNGIRGLHAPIPLVVPRAHDCITLLMGSKERYEEYFRKNPGTFFKSTGWIERDTPSQANPESGMSQLGIRAEYQKYAEQYGEENARYFVEVLGGWERHYSRMAYIDTGTGDFDHYKELTKQEAARRGWSYDEIAGGTGLLQRLMDGEWGEEEFLVVRPGEKIKTSFDDRIICTAGGEV